MPQQPPYQLAIPDIPPSIPSPKHQVQDQRQQIGNKLVMCDVLIVKSMDSGLLLDPWDP